MKWLAWFIAVAFFYYDIVLRVFPSVLVDPLMQEFHLNAEHLGIINSLYFYAYALMQIPIGILIDRFGVMKLLSFSALLAGLGSLLFGLAHHIWLLAFARILMGVGTASGFVGMLYIISHYFPANKMALLIGLGSAIGFLGAITGEGPISLLENIFDWRGIAFTMGGIGILLSILIYVVMHTLLDPTRLIKLSFLETLRGFKSILRRSSSWFNASGAFFLYVTTTCMAAFWGVPFLQNNQNMSRNLAGFANSMIYVGWIIGGPLIGLLSDRLQKRRIPILISTLFGFAALSVVSFFSLNHTVIFILLFCVGFFSGAQLLYFSHAIDLHEGETVGSVTAFINFATMIGGALFLTLFGFILDFFWTGEMIEGVRHYSQTAYMIAMSILPLSWLLAIPFTLLLKEKRA